MIKEILFSLAVVGLAVSLSYGITKPEFREAIYNAFLYLTGE